MKNKDDNHDLAVGAKVHYRLKDEAGGDTSPDFIPLSKEVVEQMKRHRALDVLRIREMKRHGKITAA